MNNYYTISISRTILARAVVLSLFLFSTCLSFGSGISSDKKNRMSHALSYSLASDLADSKSPRLFTHTIGYLGSYNTQLNFLLDLSAHVSYQSFNEEITQSSNGRAFNISDLSLSLKSRQFYLSKKTEQQVYFEYSASNKFPLSQSSRHEGYKSISSLNGGLVFKRGIYSLSGGLSSSYVFNSYETSFEGTPNLENSHLMNLGASLQYKDFSMSYGYYFGLRKTTDNIQSGFSGNRVTVGGRYKRVFAALSFSNVSRVEDQYIDAWFSDPYRKLFSFSIKVAL